MQIFGHFFGAKNPEKILDVQYFLQKACKMPDVQYFYATKQQKYRTSGIFCRVRDFLATCENV